MAPYTPTPPGRYNPQRHSSGNHVGMLRWGPRGVTIYDRDGSFITRVEHSDDIAFMNACIDQALIQLSKMQKARKQFTIASATAISTGTMVKVPAPAQGKEQDNALEIEGTDARGMERSTGQADEGRSTRVAGSNSEPVPAPGAGAETITYEEDEEVPIEGTEF
jgi:hypothetical protein